VSHSYVVSNQIISQLIDIVKDWQRMFNPNYSYNLKIVSYDILSAI